jgi:uncharacterized protein (TIGR01777 family)
MHILITGASGLIGSTLIEYLFAKGHSFYILQRNKDGTSEGFWQTEQARISADEKPFDAVIHLAGENIASGRWTSRKKQRILTSRVDGTNSLAAFCNELSPAPATFICASAIGFYGNQADRWVDEQSGYGDNFVALVCRKWEQSADTAARAGMRVVKGRIGMVLSSKGGTLPMMLPSFKLGVAGVVGNGTQYISWVELDDLVRMFEFLLHQSDISGPVNLVSPEPVTNREFTKTLGSLLKRPTVMKMPAFAAKTIFGQMGEELILSSTRVKPSVLLDHGYDFLAPTIGEALAHCLSTTSNDTGRA